MRAGRARAESQLIIPPPEWTIMTSPSYPHRFTCAVRSFRYRSKMGPRYALTTVVLVRSNSRISGKTSEEVQTYASGRILRTMSFARCSLSGLMNALRKQMATASMLRFSNNSAAWRTPASSRGSSRVPS